MIRSLFLANRLREVLLDGHWIANTNYKEQVMCTHWIQATQKVGNLNTIAALVYHIDYYLLGLLQVIKGGPLTIHDQYSFNHPEMQSEADWNNLVDNFLKHAEQFAVLVEQLDDEILDQNFVDEKYGSYLRNIEGVIEHSYYHLGQLALIKKLITQQYDQDNMLLK
jgi:hypothetical protein